MSANKSVALARTPQAATLRLRLSEVAALVQGQMVGDLDPWITGVAGIHDASDGDLTFLAQRRYRAALKQSRAAAVLVGTRERADRPAVRVANPAFAFSQVLRRFGEAMRRVYAPGIHPTASIDASAQLGRGVSIGPYVVIEGGVEIGDGTVILPGTVLHRNVQIGSQCFLHANVVLYADTVLGDRVIVHAGAVLGSDGFGYVRENDALHKVPHLGQVIVEDDVEIGANSCIDRATTGATLVRRGSKIDNLVQIAHNVKIGATTILCAQVGISGSTQVGTGVKIAGQAGLVGHIVIGDGAMIGAQAGVTKSVAPGVAVSGYPARRHATALRQQGALGRLPELLETLRQLQRRVEELEAQRRQENPS